MNMTQAVLGQVAFKVGDGFDKVCGVGWRAIVRPSLYLSLLYDELQARIVQEMLHGLFDTFI